MTGDSTVEQQSGAPAAEQPDKYTEALRRFSGDLRMTKQVFESMQERGVEVREHQWRLLLQAHLDGRDLAGARDIMDRMRAAGIEPGPATQWDVVVAMGRSGRTEEAMALVRQLEKAAVRPRPDHGRGLLRLFLAADEFGRAKQALRQMVDHGQEPEAEQYTRLVEDCLRRRAINDTEDLVDLMIAAGTPPSHEQACELVAMMASAGHPDRAARLRDRLREVDVEVDSDTHVELLSAFAETGDPEGAESVLRTIRSNGGRITSFHTNAMLRSRLQADEHEAAWETATEMADAGRVPSGRNLDGLLELSLRTGHLIRARGAVDWMLMLGVPVTPDRIGELVTRLLEADETDCALRVFREAAAHDVTSDRRAAAGLVEALVRATRLREARALLHELRAAGTLTHGKHYGSLMGAYVRQDRLEEAVTLLQRMLAAEITPAVADATGVVVAVAKDGDPSRAMSLLDSLVDAGLVIGEPTFRELLWAFARAGRYEPARAVHARMVAAGIESEPRHQKALEWASGETPRRLEEQPGDRVAGDPAPPGQGSTDQDPTDREPGGDEDPHSRAAGARASEPQVSESGASAMDDADPEAPGPPGAGTTHGDPGRPDDDAAG